MSPYFDEIIKSWIEKGLYPVYFTLFSIGFTFAVVSACFSAVAEKRKPSAFMLFLNACLSVCCYYFAFYCGDEEFLFLKRGGDSRSFALVTALVFFFALIALYALVFLLATPKKRAVEDKAEAATVAVKPFKRKGVIRELPLKASLKFKPLGSTDEAERINFRAVREIILALQKSSQCVENGLINELSETVFSCEDIAETYSLPLADALPRLLKSWAKYGG